MKKRFFALTMAVMFIISAVGASAAATNIQPNADKTTYTATFSNLKPGAMYGMLVLSGTGDNFAPSDSNILYIDQQTADASGTVKFENFALKGVAPSDANFVESSLYLGGGDFDSAEMMAVLQKILEYLKGDIDGDGILGLQDAIALYKFSRYPNLFPINYSGLTDFDKDGTVGLSDAIKLYKYCRYPNLFPLD